MFSRRTFVGTGIGTAAVAGVGLGPLASRGWAASKTPKALKFPVEGTLGLEIYSLRDLLNKDVPGTLAKIRALGFKDVEVPGLYKQSAEDMGALLKKNGLACQGYVAGFDRLNGAMSEVIKEVKALGATYAICPWIPHKGALKKDDVAKATDLFAGWAKQLQAADLKFAYHIHGFEFESSPDGTLMDTLIKSTPDSVAIEIDVFWVTRGGCDPVELLGKYPGRFSLMHLKDIAKGVRICQPNGSAPDTTSVPLGAGMIDFPGVLRAGAKAGIKLFYIEDEHPDAINQIPVSLAYLDSMKL